jgi:hypothetical protein
MVVERVMGLSCTHDKGINRQIQSAALLKAAKAAFRASVKGNARGREGVKEGEPVDIRTPSD